MLGTCLHVTASCSKILLTLLATNSLYSPRPRIQCNATLLSSQPTRDDTGNPSKAPFTRAIFVWQFLCDEFYLLVYMRTVARILCGKYICRKTSLPVFMWQTKIVNYEYLFVYMTRHIFVTCIYLHVCQALCDYNIALKTSFLHRVKKYLLYHLHEQSYLSWKIVKQKLLV